MLGEISGLRELSSPAGKPAECTDFCVQVCLTRSSCDEGFRQVGLHWVASPSRHCIWKFQEIGRGVGGFYSGVLNKGLI